MSTNETKAIVGPKNGKTVLVLGEPVTPILSGEDTDGRYAMVESLTPPGGRRAPPTHPPGAGDLLGGGRRV